MGLFDDEWSDDLSEFKTLSFEDVNKGFAGKTNILDQISLKGAPEYRSKFFDQKNIPLGESFMDHEKTSAFHGTGKNENGEQGYSYTVTTIPCESGSMVYEKYKSTAEQPHILNLFYERSIKDKNNFFGDFYIAQMGDYHVKLVDQYPNPLPAKINGTLYKNLTSLKDEAEYLYQVAYSTNGDKLDPTQIQLALMREYGYKSGNTQFEELIGSIEGIPQDALNWCADQVGKLVPDEKNYEPSHEDYSPLIPLPIGGILVPVNMNKAAQFFENLENSPFVQSVENAFATVWELVKNAASKVKDVVVEHLPDALKPLIQKISNIVNQIKTFLSDLQEVIKNIIHIGLEALKIINAFVCGIVSGLVSLVQCILYLLAFICSPITTFSYKQFLEKRSSQEKIEDVLDFIYEHAAKVFGAITSLLSKGDTDGISDLYASIGNFFTGISTYKMAYYAGCVVFEIIINILLLIFTEGAGNVIKGVTYVEKIKSLLMVILKETISVVTVGLSDLFLLLGRIIAKFIKACNTGFKALAKFFDELISGMRNGSKLDDLVQDVQEIEGVIISQRKKPLINKKSLVFSFIPDASMLKIQAIIRATEATINFIRNKLGYCLEYNGVLLYKGTLAGLRKETKKIVKILEEEGETAARRYLDDLLLQEVYRTQYIRPPGLFPKIAKILIEKKFGKVGGELFSTVENEWNRLRNIHTTGNSRGRLVLISGMADKESGTISKLFSNFTDKEIEKGLHLDFINDLHPTLRKRLEIHLQKRGVNGEGLNLADPDVMKFAWDEVDIAHAEFRALDDLLKKIDPDGKLGENVFGRILGYNSFLRKEGLQGCCADCFYLTYGVTFMK